MRTALLALAVMAHLSFGQVILYEEHFTDGVADIEWAPGWADSLGVGDSMQVDLMPENPSGDGSVGFVENVLSGGMVGTAVGGTLDMTDYMVQGWVYVTPDWGPAAMAEYKGLVARFSDQGGHFYYQLVADFNTLASGGPKLRLRLYDGNASQLIHDFFESEIPGGVPQEASWHHMGLRLEGNDIWCYWDFEELPGCPYQDTSGNPLVAGKFGVYVFSFAGEDRTYCDDIYVTDTYYNPQVSAHGPQTLPSALLVGPSFPNPAAVSATIPVTMERPGNLSLSVYDLGGGLIADLSKGWMEAGQHRFTWGTGSADGRQVAPGVYVIRASVDGQTAEGTITVLR